MNNDDLFIEHGFTIRTQHETDDDEVYEVERLGVVMTFVVHKEFEDGDTCRAQVFKMPHDQIGHDDRDVWYDEISLYSAIMQVKDDMDEDINNA